MLNQRKSSKFSSRFSRLNLTLALLLGLGSFFLPTACGLDDGDFSDVEVIEEIIAGDLEGVFGIEVADDEDAIDIDSTQVSVAKSFVPDFMNDPLRIGRQVDVSRENVSISFLDNKTVAIAEVRYLLTGEFKIVEPNALVRTKLLTHRISRNIRFVKTKNTVTGERWSRQRISAAYGSSEESALTLDSLTILIRRAAGGSSAIIVSNAAEIDLLENSIPTVKPMDTVFIKVKVRNGRNSLDPAVGFVTIGKNGVRDARDRFLLHNGRSFDHVPQDGNYTGRFIIRPTFNRGFNQLVIDFVTRSTLVGDGAYDSILIFLPYRVID